MADEEKKVPSILVENLSILTTPEGIQKYILGTKKNGNPRAVYDVVKDYTKMEKKHKKKKKKKNGSSSYEFYISTKKGKKKKKNKKKHWHI